jgi:hypothetical protein
MLVMYIMHAMLSDSLWITKQGVDNISDATTALRILNQLSLTNHSYSQCMAIFSQPLGHLYTD